MKSIIKSKRNANNRTSYRSDSVQHVNTAITPETLQCVHSSMNDKSLFQILNMFVQKASKERSLSNQWSYQFSRSASSLRENSCYNNKKTVYTAQWIFYVTNMHSRTSMGIELTWYYRKCKYLLNTSTDAFLTTLKLFQTWPRWITF